MASKKSVTKRDPMADTTLPYTLRAIYLRDSTTRMVQSFDPLTPGQVLTAVFRNGEGIVDCRETTLDEAGEKRLVRSCTFRTKFDFAYALSSGESSSAGEDDIEKDLIVQITAEIAADYLFSGDVFPDQEALQKWATSNVLLHTWPYWREFCHAAMLRMNLPVTMIPMIQFNQNNGEK